MNCGDFKSHNTFNKGAHVIVIGSSIAGLLASRILTNYFDRVTIVERDFLPQVNAFRPGAPQSRQLHVLLKRGQVILSSYAKLITYSFPKPTSTFSTYLTKFIQLS